MGCTASKANADHDPLVGKTSRGSRLTGGLTGAQEKLMNLQIDQEMEKAGNKEASKIHLMILGTGDSGKTTLRKQLVNINTNQFSKVDFRQNFATQIIGNVVDGVLEVFTNLDDENPGEYRNLVDQVTDAARSCTDHFDPTLAELLNKVIWDTPKFQETVQEKKGKEIQLQDCFFSYAEQLKTYPTWGGKGWVPSVEDCIRSRARTSGVIKEDVIIENVPFVIYDVGGQRSERRKWMHMFDHVTSTIFVAAISEYDQVLFEERGKNRLEESFDLFGECINSSWLKDATTILFLNKKDLFLKKFLEDKVPLNASGLFPTAPTDNTNVDGAVEWISNQFKSKRIAKDPIGELKGAKKQHMPSLYIHVTTATDPQNVKTVFKVAKDVILKTNLVNAGFAAF